MFPWYFSGEITNWPRLPCYSLYILIVFPGSEGGRGKRVKGIRGKSWRGGNHR